MKKKLILFLAILSTFSGYGIDRPQNVHQKAIGPQYLVPPHKKSNTVKKGLQGSSGQEYRPVYFITSVGSGGNTLYTHDETVWLISSRDARKASRWSAQSPITITPNYSYFSSYDYRLINQTTRESVKANLSQGPLMKYALFIRRIDSYGYIELEDNSQWKVNRSSRFYTWKIGQAVLLGENSSWFGREHILVNINENNYMTASRQH